MIDIKMNDTEMLELLKTLNFLKRCDIVKCFLYRISKEIYYIHAKEVTEKHCLEGSNTMAKGKKIFNIQKGEIFQEFAVGNDSEIKAKLKDEEVVVKRVSDKLYEMHIVKAVKYIVNLKGIEGSDIIGSYMTSKESRIIDGAISPMNQVIYDKESKEWFDKAKILITT